MTTHTTRSSGSSHPDILKFPANPSFVPSTQLPTYKSVIGMFRYRMEGIGREETVEMVAREVAKHVYAKWYYDTVYCLSLSTIIRRVRDLWTIVTAAKKRWKRGGPAVDEYMEVA